MTNCDSCVNYQYDEDDESYSCSCELDQDEMYRFMSCATFDCPYYRLDDEYAVVRKQM